MSDSDTSRFKRLRLCCQVSALAAMGIGVLVMFGWAFHIGTLLSIFPGYVSMKVNTALGLVFAGTSLWLLLPGESFTRRGQIARFLALVVVLIGAATLIEYFSGLNLGIDQLIFGDPGSNATSSPGRLAPTTATAFLTIGLALMLLHSKVPRIRWTAQALSLWTGFIAMMAINGYFYRAVVPSRIWVGTQVAVPTAIALLLLSGGVFFARPRSGIAGDLTGEGSGSLMARRFLPAVFLIPIVLGWIALQGEFAGLYGGELGMALYATISILAFVVLVWSNARKMNGDDQRSSRAKIDIRELNTELEGRVAERTAQIEGRYRGLLEAAPDAMVVVNVGGDIVLLNVRAEKQFGYSRGELIGQKVKNIIPEGFAERIIADGTRSAAEAHAQQIGTGIELVGRRRDASEFPIEIMLSPLESAEGILVTAAIRDISARKGAENHLAQMEGRYRGLLEAAPDAMVVVNVAGEIVLLNVQAEKEFGYSRDELIGQKVKNIVPEGFAERIIADALRSAEDALAQQIGTGLELTGRRRNGSEFPIEIMLSPLESADGILVTAAIRDISERKGAEAHLLRKLDELSRSNEELGQFAYIASHDLQEPLRMVASYTQLLSRKYKGKLDAEADEFINFAVDGANRMQRLIQDLLAFSRVGTKGKDMIETSSEATLLQALRNLRSAIEESGAQVTHDPLPAVLADEMQLTQLFQNLVGNAIKYQKTGNIARVHISAARNGDEKWIFSVKDNGLGIEPEYFEKIFGMFQRLHKREEFAGTGIGLAICKKIAERHGTTISVESQLGEGATFRFALEASEKKSCTPADMPMEETVCP